MAGIFSSVEKNIIGGITDATNGLMMSYSSMMMGLAATSATIYIMWRGYQTLAGKLSTPMEDVMWDIMRMAIILSFVANINGYLDGVIDAVNGIKEGFSSSTSIWQLLDTLWNSARVLGKTLHDLDNSEFIKEEGTIAICMGWCLCLNDYHSIRIYDCGDHDLIVRYYRTNIYILPDVWLFTANV